MNPLDCPCCLEPARVEEVPAIGKDAGTWYYIYCSEYECEYAFEAMSKDRDEAVTEWNRRVFNQKKLERL